MARHKSRAFVLGAADYRETSKLLQLFCENEGRISVIARGLRSPKSRKAQLADTFNLLQVNYTLKDGATLGLLTSLEPEGLYSSLRINLEAYALATYWFEILKVAGQARLASHEVFQITQRFLDGLCDSGSVNVCSVRSMVMLTQELGFGLELRSCAVCGTMSEISRFNVASGAAVCRSCPAPPGRMLTIPQALSLALGQLDISPPDSPLAPEAKSAFLHIFNEFLTTHLDHRLTTFGFLREVCNC